MTELYDQYETEAKGQTLEELQVTYAENFALLGKLRDLLDLGIEPDFHLPNVTNAQLASAEAVEKIELWVQESRKTLRSLDSYPPTSLLSREDLLGLVPAVRTALATIGSALAEIGTKPAPGSQLELHNEYEELYEEIRLWFDVVYNKPIPEGKLSKPDSVTTDDWNRFMRGLIRQWSRNYRVHIRQILVCPAWDEDYTRPELLDLVRRAKEVLGHLGSDVYVEGPQVPQYTISDLMTTDLLYQLDRPGRAWQMSRLVSHQ